jgi:hypothetical protein
MKINKSQKSRETVSLNKEQTVREVHSTLGVFISFSGWLFPQELKGRSEI